MGAMLIIGASLPGASVGLAAGSSATDVRITQDGAAGNYLRYDGATDGVMAACSTGRRGQVEPAVAVDPQNPKVIVAGANDFCQDAATPTVNGNPNVWLGYYRSTDGGTRWQDSLVPGYPGDTSAAAAASPLPGFCSKGGDPSQAFDNAGRLFYGFVCFNWDNPFNLSVFVATYDQDGARYLRTVPVELGTPSSPYTGQHQDKDYLAVDRTTGPTAGNIYLAWSGLSGSVNANQIVFSRSTDHGQTFSSPQVVTSSTGSKFFTSLAVGPDGAIYLGYRVSTQGSVDDGIYLVKSTDGGVTFGPAAVVATISAFDSQLFSAGGGTSCGDGPAGCPNGLTLSAFRSYPSVAADATGVHVVWSSRLANGQAKMFSRSSPDGLSWPSPAVTLDSLAVGHQYDPAIASADGVISAVFYDSRNDTSYAPGLPPGDTADGRSSGGAIDAFMAQSSDGGGTWAERRLSRTSSNPNWENLDDVRSPFFGDYISVSAVPSGLFSVWADSRDVVPGSDPRDPAPNDGFDGFQTCTWSPNDISAGTYTAPLSTDPCLSQGGQDINVYGSS